MKLNVISTPRSFKIFYLAMVFIAAVVFMANAPLSLAATQNLQENSNLNQAYAKPNGIPEQLLGGGYSIDMQMPIGIPCLKDGVVSYDGGSQGVIALGDKQSFDEIERSLNASVSASANIGMFSAEASANYARYIKEDSYSESFYYYEAVKLPTKRLQLTAFGVNALNDFGKMAYAAGKDQFRASCGDKFAQQEPIGTKLFVTLKLNFSSLADKENFNAHIAGKFGTIFSASADLQQAVNQNHINGALEVSAYQEGGDPMHLANIFKDCGGHYCVSTCSLNKLSDCSSVVDGVISYAQKDLPKQVDFQGGKVIGNPQPLDYIYTDYATIGLDVGQSVLTPEITAARAKLGDLYKNTKKQSTFVDHILKSEAAPYLVKSEKEKLENTAEVLHSNILILSDTQNGAIGCFLHPTQCVTIAQQISSELLPIDQKLIDDFNNAYRVSSRDSTFADTIPLGAGQYSFNHRGQKPVWERTPILITKNDHDLILYLIFDQPLLLGTLHKTAEGIYSGVLLDKNYVTYTEENNPL